MDPLTQVMPPLIQVDDTVEWQVVKPEAFATIMDFFASGLPVVNEEEAAGTMYLSIYPCSNG